MKKIFAFVCILVVSLQAQSGPDARSLAEHLALGNPSRASADVSSPQNYLMVKPQFVLSYNRFTGIPNWVAWHTDSSWLGDVQRSNDFRADSSLPDQWYRVHEKSYRRSGYDRGHMCPSGDRTNTAADNSATFIMTNMIPQAPNNNQGPWAALEIYCRELVKQGKEVYIYCGGLGESGFIDSGRVQIPEQTWKAILVLDAGENDQDRVTATTRTIAVLMPNDNGLIGKKDDWRSYRVSIDRIEAVTGFDLFSALPPPLQSSLEKIVDAE